MIGTVETICVCVGVVILAGIAACYISKYYKLKDIAKSTALIILLCLDEMSDEQYENVKKKLSKGGVDIDLKKVKRE